MHVCLEITEEDDEMTIATHIIPNVVKKALDIYDAMSVEMAASTVIYTSCEDGQQSITRDDLQEMVRYEACGRP